MADLYRARLDALMPFRGPCGICGHPDARHRTLDAALYRPKYDAAAVASDLGVPLALVQLVRAWQRRGR